MKSFEEIVDKCFKPEKPNGDKHQFWVGVPSGIFSSKELIQHLYVYSGWINKPFYGKDINEPVIKICKRILSNPDRFYLECITYKNKQSSKWDLDGFFVASSHSVLDKLVVVDKDTNQKFIIKGYTLKSLTCLTEDENTLLVAALLEWYYFMKGKLDKKKTVKEQKRKDKFRQELTDLYKDL